MSGRPQGPYTVKYLRPIMEMPKMWLYVCAIISLAFFVAAYRLAGLSTMSSSEKGVLVLRPYTELEDAYTILGIGSAFLATSNNSTKPAIFEETYDCGCFVA